MSPTYAYFPFIAMDLVEVPASVVVTNLISYGSEISTIEKSSNADATYAYFPSTTSPSGSPLNANESVVVGEVGSVTSITVMESVSVSVIYAYCPTTSKPSSPLPMVARSNPPNFVGFVGFEIS